MGWRIQRANRPTLSPEAQWRRKRKTGLVPGIEGKIQHATLKVNTGEFAEALTT